MLFTLHNKDIKYSMVNREEEDTLLYNLLNFSVSFETTSDGFDDPVEPVKHFTSFHLEWSVVQLIC